MWIINYMSNNVNNYAKNYANNYLYDGNMWLMGTINNLNSNDVKK